MNPGDRDLNDRKLSPLESNLKAIRKKHPDLYRFIQESAYTGTSSQSKKTEEKDTFRQIKINSFDPDSIRFPLVFGLASGEWISELYNNNQGKLYRMALVEPAIENFIDFLRSTDASPLFYDPKVCWIVGSEMQKLETFLRRNYTGIGIWGISLFSNLDSQKNYPTLYGQFLDIASKVEGLAYENIRVQSDRGKIIQYNIIHNLPWILRSVPSDHCENKLISVPAVVVGAGPSLNKNIEQLCKLPSGFVLIASDTALKPLLKHGIQPHILVTCDPTPLNLNHFQCINSLDKTTLAFLPESYHEILDKFSDHIRLMALHDLESKTLRRLAPMLDVNGNFHRSMNVGCCAFSLARQLGCSPIILVGMDLAISPSGRSHAEDTENLSDVQLNPNKKSVRLSGKVESQETPIVEVEGYEGNHVYTFTYFNQTLLLLESTIANMDTPVIDATEGGAKKKGAIQLPLREVFQRYSTGKDIHSLLDSFFQNQIQPDNQLIILALSDLQKGILDNLNLLENGRLRLRQWIEIVHSNQPSLEQIEKEKEMFYERWKAILHEPVLDTAVDIGLAKWRIETWRMNPPTGLSPIEEADWWYDKLTNWFAELQEDLKLFAQAYALTMQRLKKSFIN